MFPRFRNPRKFRLLRDTAELTSYHDDVFEKRVQNAPDIRRPIIGVMTLSL